MTFPPVATTKPHLGHAVKNGRVRFLSVSQIQLFDASHEDTACPRRWYFNYVIGKKEPKTGPLDIGIQCAKEGENYLVHGVDALGPIMRAGKHLMPKPGADLEVEVPIGNIYEAARLRDEALAGTRVVTDEEMWRVAGLVAGGIPLTGAPDFRHRRGEYVDADGVICKELPGLRVVETGDHKTTSRIFDHVSAGGKVYPGYAKTVEQILDNTQMVGYGRAAAYRYPDATHSRLSHLVYQTKNGFMATKRTGLIEMVETVRKWERLDGVAREMDSTAGASRPEDVDVNLRACRAYNKDCTHMSYCNRPEGSVRDLFQLRGTTAATTAAATTETGGTMTTGLFDMVKKDTNGVAATPAAAAAVATMATPTATTPTGLFGAPDASVAAAPAPPVLTDEQRHAIYEAEKARLLAEEAATTTVATIPGTTIPVAVVAAINPPDMPAPDPVAAASALPPHVIATITDPELKKRAEDHAAAAAARAAAEAAASPTKEKTSGRCSAGGQKITLTTIQAVNKKIGCPTCGKELRVKPEQEGEAFVVVLGGHLMPKKEAAVNVEVAAAVNVEAVAAVNVEAVAAVTEAAAVPPAIPSIPTITVAPAIPSIPMEISTPPVVAIPPAIPTTAITPITPPITALSDSQMLAAIMAKLDQIVSMLAAS